MRHPQLTNLLKKRSLLLSLLLVAPLVGVILGLTACVKYPVGDPEKSKVDPQYAGAWSREDDGKPGELLLIRPYDPRTYLVTTLEYQVKDGKIVPTDQSLIKAWLVPLGKSTFMTLENLALEHFAGIGDAPPYLVMKISLNEGTLRWQMINPDYEPIKKAQNSQELEEAIAKNLDDESLYDKEVVLEFKKADDKTHIEAVLKAFHFGA